MSHAIQPGTLPPPPGLEREEPDLWQEDDIPRPDNSVPDEEFIDAGPKE